MKKASFVFVLLLVSAAFALTLEQKELIPTERKSVTNGDLTMDIGLYQVYNAIYPDHATHYYVFTLQNRELTAKSINSVSAIFTPKLSDKGANLANAKFYAMAGYVEKGDSRIAGNVTYSVEWAETSFDKITMAGSQKATYLLAIDTPAWSSGSFDVNFLMDGKSLFLDPDVDACGTINAAGHYDMTADVKDVGPAEANYCLTISASDVELDGNHHTLYGLKATDDDNYIAVWANGGANAFRERVNITNITLIGWNNPIIFTNWNFVNISNTYIVDNQSSTINGGDSNILACQLYYGCVVLWRTNNTHLQNVNCTQSNRCGKGLMLNEQLIAAVQSYNMTILNYKVNSTNSTGMRIWNTNNIFIQDVNMTDLNVTGALFQNCDNVSINRLNISYMSNKIPFYGDERAGLTFNRTNATVNEYYFDDTKGTPTTTGQKAIYLINNSKVSIENSTIIMTASALNASVNVSDGAVLNMTNLTYTCSNCFGVSHPRATSSAEGNLTVRHQLRVNVTDAAGNPLAGVALSINSNASIIGAAPLIIAPGTATDATGLTPYYYVSEYIGNFTRNSYFNNYVFTATLAGYFDNSSYQYNTSNQTSTVHIVLSSSYVPPGGGGGGGSGGEDTCTDGTLYGECSRNAKCTTTGEDCGTGDCQTCAYYRCASGSLVVDDTCGTTPPPPEENKSILAFFVEWLKGITGDIPNIALFVGVMGITAFSDISYSKGKHVWLIILVGAMVGMLYLWYG